MYEAEIHPQAQPYYDRADLATAIQSAKERIEGWSYDDDLHGYCHVRPDLILLVQAAEK